jgi:hypothetical protein
MKPSDYPLHSSQSRAAARMLLEHREQQNERMEAICVDKDLNEPHASAWVEIEANRMHRVVRLSAGGLSGVPVERIDVLRARLAKHQR